MAATNVTIDDTSPLVLYDSAGAWAHPSGSDARPYTNSTYSSTAVEGATAKFAFNGTGFWVYGAKKPNYGQFILMLDGQVIDYSSATSKEPVYKELLGRAWGLKNGEHTVVLMAAGGGPMDLDSIMYETTDPQEMTVAPSCAETMDSAASTQSAQTYSQGPVTSNSQWFDSLSAVPMTVTIPSDPTPSQVVSSTPSIGITTPTALVTPASPSEQPIAQANGQIYGPSDGQSTAAPSAAEVNAGSSDSFPSPTSTLPSTAEAIDSQSEYPSGTANVLAPSVSQADRGGQPQIATTSQAHQGLPLGAIIGIVVGGIVLLLVLIGLVLFLRRRRSTARQRNILASPILPLQDPDMEGGYFFGPGRGGVPNPTREKYIAQPISAMLSQTSSNSGTTLRGRAMPTSEKPALPYPSAQVSLPSSADRVVIAPQDLPKAPPRAAVRESVSVYTDDTSSQDEYDIAEMYSSLPPSRPPRPQDLRLSV